MPFLRQSFQKPDKNYQPVYAWVWDAPLSEEGIRAQMHTMYENGVLGVYVIPEPKAFRPSRIATTLEPEYMSDDYMRMVRVMADTADELGMAMWLYDEGGWPSGSVCTQINRLRPDLARKVISRERFFVKAGTKYNQPVSHKGFLTAFVQRKGKEPERLDAPFTADGNLFITEYSVKSLIHPKQPWPGETVEGEEYTYNTDIADPETGRLFIEMTHEKYYKAVGDKFGKLIPLFFDDEPHLDSNSWTPGLADKFKERYGYDMLDFLPWITREVKWTNDVQRQAIIDYRLLICELLLQNFFLPLRRWCEEHGVSSAGHLGGEHRADYLIYDVPTYANPMEILRSFHIPGVDAIWGQIMPDNEPNDPRSPDKPCVPFYPRLASSATRQMGGNLSLTESLGVYGDGTTPDLTRYVIGFQAVRGINIFSYIGFVYGRDGHHGLVERPVFDERKPGFGHLCGENEYLARLSYLCQLGPTEAKTGLYLPVNDLLVGESAEPYHNLGNELEAAHIDFDIVDDAILRKAEEKDGCLKAGLASYSRIYVPDGTRLPEDVKQKIAPYLSKEPEPVFRCTAQRLRGQKRRLPDGSTVCYIFNEDKVAVEDEIDLLDARPAYRLGLYEGKIYAAPGKKQKIHLKWGEMAAFLLTNDVVETDEEKKECAWALLLERFTLNRVKQFEITPAGMKAKMIEEEAQPVALGADWTERYGWEFSGEAVYHCKAELPEEPKPDDEYELDLGEVKYTADVRVNGMAAGVSALSPHIVRLKGEQLKKQCEIEIRVANTAANQCVSADIRAYWPERFVGPYHETQKVFEREMLDGGLAGPVILRKMK